MPAVGRADAQAPAGGAPDAANTKSEREKWFARAAAVMPYGVSSNFRYWGDADTMIVRKAQGAYLWDVDGKRYLDYRLGFGPVILGHAFPAVTQAVAEAMTNGNTFALTNMYEVQAAERFVRMTNTDMVRLDQQRRGKHIARHSRCPRAHQPRQNY